MRASAPRASEPESPRLQQIPVGAIDPRRLDQVVSPAGHEQLFELIAHGASALRGRVVWNVNSTASGGGVVELLRPLLGYARGGGVDARWLVISGDDQFFAITKRLHNRLHGADGDGGALGPSERNVYAATLQRNARRLVELLHPSDIVILHDPQTAGLVTAVRQTGATVIWRCHVGMDDPNDYARDAWQFLKPQLVEAQAFVFSRASFVWEGLDRRKVCVIQPSIDPFSPKNADQTGVQTTAILARSGLVHYADAEPATFTRADGTPGRVDRTCDMLESEPLDVDDRLVVQISRWDALKDPIGVLFGFCEHIAQRSEAHLLLAGPAPGAVTDDPDAAGVLAALREAWRDLPAPVRARVHLAVLPMEDHDENAAIVNALQRHAGVITQKSLAEGFGLTVAEAMWKERPVVGSRIGGIQDQIVDGESGVLIDDPRDLRAFGSAIVSLLRDQTRARRIGIAARLRVRDQFLGPQHLGHYFELIRLLIAGQEPVPASKRSGPMVEADGAPRRG